MHMKLCDLEMGSATGTLIFPKRFLPKERWDETAMGKAKQRIERHLDIIERELAGRDYLVGDAYSLVEVCYTPFVEFLPLMEIAPPPGVAAWAARMLARPSAKQTKPDI
jgi:glutathione S-transferase